MIKKLLVAFCIFSTSFIIYLVVPYPQSPGNDVAEFLPEQATAFVADQAENREKCRHETFYIRQVQLGYADSEVVDERCANLQRDLSNAAIDGDLDKMRLLLQHGASAQAQGFSKYSGDAMVPVVRAALNGQTLAVKLLLDNGADVNSEYYCCMTSKSLLMITVSRNDEATTKLLLSRHADTSFKDRFEGQDVFVEANRKNNPAILEMLYNFACDSTVSARIKCQLNRVSRLFR